MELTHWSAAQDQARQLRADEDWPRLWRHILSLPVPHAVEAAQYLALGEWRPPDDADHQLAQVLVDADPHAITQVLGSVLSACTQARPEWLETLCPAAFAFREPVAALNVLSEDMSTSRIVTIGRNGLLRTLYEGPAMHYSLCCLDAGTVIARREFESGSRGDSQIVEYTATGEALLASGGAQLDAQVLATAHGFVVGFKLVAAAVAVADGNEAELDLSRHGLRRGDVLAVDAAGTRIAFADGNRILVTDTRLQPLLADVVDVTITAVAFTADALVVAGDRGELRRFVLTTDRLAAASSTAVRTPRVLFDLAPVPAWDLVVGDGGNERFFFDASTLDRIPAPRFLGDTNYAVGEFTAAPQGRFAVYGSRLFPVGQDDPDGRFPTVVHDLGHPLNTLAKPVRSLTPGDAAADSAYQLSPLQEEVLDLVRRAAAVRPTAAEDAGSGLATGRAAPAGRDRRASRKKWWSR
jgi:hypothetical protein